MYVIQILSAIRHRLYSLCPLMYTSVCFRVWNGYGGITKLRVDVTTKEFQLDPNKRKFTDAALQENESYWKGKISALKDAEMILIYCVVRPGIPGVYIKSADVRKWLISCLF